MPEAEPPLLPTAKYPEYGLVIVGPFSCLVAAFSIIHIALLITGAFFWGKRPQKKTRYGTVGFVLLCIGAGRGVLALGMLAMAKLMGWH